MKTPVVESTGTGGGMKLFCAGVGESHPDATNASRRMKKSEFEDCQKNGVKDIVEINIGFDGLTVAQSKQGRRSSSRSRQLFLALAKEVPGPDGKLVANPNKNWTDIDPSLPNIKIEVLGPPPTSGTRDSFHELLLEKGAEQVPALAALKKSDAKAFDEVWKTIREDGAYVEAGENDNVIVAEARSQPERVRRFRLLVPRGERGQAARRAARRRRAGLRQHRRRQVQGRAPLYVYVKKQHVGVVPGLDKFVAEYVSTKAIGEDGYLAKKGLVTLPKTKPRRFARRVIGMAPMTADPLS